MGMVSGVRRWVLVGRQRLELDFSVRYFHAGTVLLKRKTRSQILRPRTKSVVSPRRKKVEELKKTPFMRPKGWQDRPPLAGMTPSLDEKKDFERTYENLMGGLQEGESREENERKEAEEMVSAAIVPENDEEDVNDGNATEAEAGEEWRDRSHLLDVFDKETKKEEEVVVDESLRTPDVEDVVAFSKWRRRLEMAKTDNVIKIFFERRSRCLESYEELISMLIAFGHGGDIPAVIKSMRADRIPITIDVFCEATAAVTRTGLTYLIDEISKTSKIGHRRLIFYDKMHNRIDASQWLNICRAQSHAENGDVDSIRAMMVQTEADRVSKEIPREPRLPDHVPIAIPTQSDMGEDAEDKVLDVDEDAEDAFQDGEDLSDFIIKPRKHKQFVPGQDDASLSNWDNLGSNVYLWASLLKAYRKRNDFGSLCMSYHWFKNKCSGQRQPASVYENFLLGAQNATALERANYSVSVFNDLRTNGVRPTPAIMSQLIDLSKAQRAKQLMTWAENNDIDVGERGRISAIRALRRPEGSEGVTSSLEKTLDEVDEAFESLVAKHGGVQFVDIKAFAETMAVYGDLLRKRVLRERRDTALYGEPNLSEEERNREPEELTRARKLIELLQERKNSRSVYQQNSRDQKRVSALLFANYINVLLWADRVSDAVELVRTQLVPVGPIAVSTSMTRTWAGYLDNNLQSVTVDDAWFLFQTIQKSGVHLNYNYILCFSRFFCVNKDVAKAEEAALCLKYVDFNARMIRPAALEYLNQLTRLVDDPERFKNQMHALGVPIDRRRTWIKTPKKNQAGLPGTLRGVNWWQAHVHRAVN